MKQDAVTWLDFRADDLAQAKDFIRQMQEEGVIDELGFLALQGRFSDLLHPATTTLLRASRYLYFIPAIYRQLEREEVRSNQIRTFAQQRQDQLATVLAVNEKVGVIGKESGLKLAQFPSLLYWSSLRKLGMFTSLISERGYQDQFDDIRRERRGYADDDKTPQGSEGLQFWDDLPPVTFFNSQGQAKSGTSFKLTRLEAQDLFDRFNTRFKDSLLSHMLNKKLTGIEWPWDVPKPSAELAVWLWHGKNLSLFVRGATLQYHAMVVDELVRRKIRTGGDSLLPQFTEWWAEAHGSLKKWKTDEFVTVSTVASAMRLGAKGDRWFIDGWLARCLAASSAEALWNDPKARELVREREFRIKPAKARLRHLKHLKQWRPERVGSSMFQFNYRHLIGDRFVSEILASLDGAQ